MVFSKLKELAPWQFKYRAFNLQSLYELKHVPEGAGLNSHRCLDGNPPVQIPRLTGGREMPALPSAAWVVRGAVWKTSHHSMML